jgi:hypothetical protein
MARLLPVSGKMVVFIIDNVPEVSLLKCVHSIWAYYKVYTIQRQHATSALVLWQELRRQDVGSGGTSWARNLHPESINYYHFPLEVNILKVALQAPRMAIGMSTERVRWADLCHSPFLTAGCSLILLVTT